MTNQNKKNLDGEFAGEENPYKKKNFFTEALEQLKLLYSPSETINYSNAVRSPRIANLDAHRTAGSFYRTFI